MAVPKLDEQLVAHLAGLAEQLDGGDENGDQPLLEEFNRLAGTNIPFDEFQGIYGAEEHETYVRRVLVEQMTEAQPNLTRDELVEMFQQVNDDPGDEEFLAYVMATIEKTYDDDQVSDLLFYPGEYFGDGDNNRELTSEMMADAVLERYSRNKK